MSMKINENCNSDQQRLRIKQLKKNAERIKKEGKMPKVYDIMKKTKEDWGSEPSGTEKSICESCKKEFKQDYHGERNMYSNYKSCLNCRRKKRFKEEKGEIDNKTIISKAQIEYEPYDFQVEMHNAFETHRFLFLCAGNRLGKDFFTVMAGIQYTADILNEKRYMNDPTFIPAYRWWLIAPTEDMAKETVWLILKQYFPKNWIKKISDAEMTIETYGGGLIECKSAYDPDKLVGVALDLVTITEAARIANLKTVYGHLAARLVSAKRGRSKDRPTGKNFGVGKMIVNSSPIGKGEFYELYKYGVPGSETHNPQAISFQFPWTANPDNADYAKMEQKTKYGIRTNEEILIAQIGLKAYQQNYLGMFITAEGAVFGDYFENCLVHLDGSQLNLSKKEKKEYLKKWQEVIPHRKYRVSWDISMGGSSDSPVALIRDMEDGKIVMLIDMTGKGYDQQYDEVAFWCKKYNNAECVYSLTGHTPVKGQLEKRGVWEKPTDEQGGRKQAYVQKLELAVQNGALKVLVDGTEKADTLVRQMNDYSKKGNKYGNLQEKHDDWVSAMYLNFYDYEVETESVSFIGLMGCV